jgi:hypothetical protein
VIRGAVIHVLNEQPMRADLYELPKPSDVGLLCTNLRTLSGKQPVFVDSSDAVFFFPYVHIRFVEIPPERATAGAGPEVAAARAPEPSDADLELDEDFLRRVREA